MIFYKLDENNNAEACDISDYLLLYKTADGQERRRVGSDDINGYHVSTVFLGIDHGHGFTEHPLLFETLIFGDGELDQYQTRCSTWDEAVEMHRVALELVKNRCKDGVDL